MTIQHTTIYHCQECGRVVYQPRGMPAPICCGEAMVCAVVDLARETAEPARSPTAPRGPAGRTSSHRSAEGYISMEASHEHSTI
jgi:hypothetical protein